MLKNNIGLLRGNHKQLTSKETNKTSGFLLLGKSWRNVSLDDNQATKNLDSIGSVFHGVLFIDKSVLIDPNHLHY